MDGMARREPSTHFRNKLFMTYSCFTVRPAQEKMRTRKFCRASTHACRTRCAGPSQLGMEKRSYCIVRNTLIPRIQEHERVKSRAFLRCPGRDPLHVSLCINAQFGCPNGRSPHEPPKKYELFSCCCRRREKTLRHKGHTDIYYKRSTGPPARENIAEKPTALESGVAPWDGAWRTGGRASKWSLVLSG